MASLTYLFLALAAGFALGRLSASTFSRSFQNRGEALLSHVVRENLRSPDYHLMNHLTLEMGDGTTQVDHILVSRFGVFVIETKDFNGWILANAKHPNWTQVMFRAKFKFQNPLFQNHRHLLAVQKILEFLPSEAIKPVVVFTGEAEFKSEIPEGVFGLSSFINYIHGQTAEVMSLNRMQFCVGRLETTRLAITGATDVEHIESLDRRHQRRF